MKKLSTASASTLRSPLARAASKLVNTNVLVARDVTFEYESWGVGYQFDLAAEHVPLLYDQTELGSYAAGDYQRRVVDAIEGAHRFLQESFERDDWRGEENFRPLDLAAHRIFGFLSPQWFAASVFELSRRVEELSKCDPRDHEARENWGRHREERAALAAQLQFRLLHEPATENVKQRNAAKLRNAVKAGQKAHRAGLQRRDFVKRAALEILRRNPDLPPKPFLVKLQDACRHPPEGASTRDLFLRFGKKYPNGTLINVSRIWEKKVRDEVCSTLAAKGIRSKVCDACAARSLPEKCD